MPRRALQPVRPLLACGLAVCAVCAGCAGLPRPARSDPMPDALPTAARLPIGAAAVCEEHIRFSPATSDARGSERTIDRSAAYLSEAVQSPDGLPLEVRQSFGHWQQTQIGPGGRPRVSTPKIAGLQVHLRRAGDGRTTQAAPASAPPELTRGRQDAMLETCLPAEAVAAGGTWRPGAPQCRAWALRLDGEAASSDRIDCTLVGVYLKQRPTGDGQLAASEPIRCAVVSFRWEHVGRVLDFEQARVELSGTMWIDLGTGLPVHRVCSGEVRRAGGAGAADGPVLGTLGIELIAWPVAAGEAARLRPLLTSPGGPVELPSDLIFRAAAPLPDGLPIV
jgi:hypothetical protein